jgi:hypothetical protein
MTDGRGREGGVAKPKDRRKAAVMVAAYRGRIPQRRRAMRLFKTQMLQEAPRHVAGPYTARYARRYGRRDAGRPSPRPSWVGIEPNLVAIREAERELLRRMSDYDLAA